MPTRLTKEAATTVQTSFVPEESPPEELSFETSTSTGMRSIVTLALHLAPVSDQAVLDPMSFKTCMKRDQWASATGNVPPNM
mmetsp:Transcript_12259/g.30885  ORF Transcript_12259/g.30885 Transcript_12259/m.30885 type:complete len:82 (+) Transcript_12259:478-723(+)